MASKKSKGLGRGLEALLGPLHREEEVSTTGRQDPYPDTPNELWLSDIVAGQYQPRTRMDEGALYELAESIKAQGIMQPILVRRLHQAPSEAPLAKYEIIAGERRFRAAKLAGLEKVPVLVRDVPDESAAAMALIENIQREDLNPLEEAQGLQRLIKEFGLTHEQVAKAVGRSRSATTNLLRLLNLAEPVQTMLFAGDIDMGHARALLALEKAAQITTANQVVAKSLSVRDTEILVRRLTKEFALAPTKKVNEKSGDISRIEEQLSDALGMKVEIRIKKRLKRMGKTIEQGEMLFHFASIEELNTILQKIQKE